ncbi:MAG: hypothetical protein ACXV0U_11250 [Kineosporiaceae bacterium]
MAPTLPGRTHDDVDVRGHPQAVEVLGQQPLPLLGEVQPGCGPGDVQLLGEDHEAAEDVDPQVH